MLASKKEKKYIQAEINIKQIRK